MRSVTFLKGPPLYPCPLPVNTKIPSDRAPVTHGQRDIRASSEEMVDLPRYPLMLHPRARYRIRTAGHNAHAGWVVSPFEPAGWRSFPAAGWSGILGASAPRIQEAVMEPVKDSSHLYEVERRARHAERPGFRISELQIAPSQRVP